MLNSDLDITWDQRRLAHHILKNAALRVKRAQEDFSQIQNPKHPHMTLSDSGWLVRATEEAGAAMAELQGFIETVSKWKRKEGS